MVSIILVENLVTISLWILCESLVICATLPSFFSTLFWISVTNDTSGVISMCNLVEHMLGIIPSMLAARNYSKGCFVFS